jgi:hypothetical protein
MNLNLKWYVCWFPGCQKVMVKVEISGEQVTSYREPEVLRQFLTPRAEEIARDELSRLGIEFKVGGNTRSGYPREAKWVDEDGTILVRALTGPEYKFHRFEAWYYFPIIVFQKVVVPPTYSDEDRAFDWREV